MKNINKYVNEFYINQKKFEENLELMKEHYVDDKSIQKILQQVKEVRKREL